jgi:acyl-coenzyme A thioesterase PaaI-like protein
MNTAPLPPYRVSAYNTAHDSENKIHDDATARRFGFGGGLVPGVDVYGYMTHMPVARWGRAWLERGTAECRFFKPVYDGETATVTAGGSAEEIEIAVESRGERCATGRAALPVAPPAVPPLDSFRKVAQRTERPPADEASLAAGTWLGLDPYRITPELASQHRTDLREHLPLYAAEGLIHPALILRACNFVINRNVSLGPWIHVSSRVQHLAAARIGMCLSARGRVTANYEHKGHRFVDVDVLVLADEKPIAHISHLAIYKPRQIIGG